MAEIILTFEWDGETIKKETKGFIGKECTAKTSFLEEALGNAKKRTYKSEYYNNGETEKGKEKHSY